MEDSSHAINSHGKEIAKMIKHFLFYTLTILAIIFSQPVFCCSMDMTSASVLVIQAIIKSIPVENKPSDREITKIEKAQIKNLPYWTYIVETSINGGACQAIGYAVDIDPSCQIKVKRLDNAFVCK